LSKRVGQGCGLVDRWLQLYLDGEQHSRSITCSILDATQNQTGLLPVLNGGVSAPEIR
jgi:hypothetical protein